MTAPLVVVDRLSRRLSLSFRLAVERLEVAAGETLALVGPTGSGKSTLLRLLTGLFPADEGTISLDGTALGPTSPVAALRRIAWVPQTPRLATGDVRYNVEYGLRVRGRPTDGHVDRLLERLELRGLAAQSSRTLSGGQVQLTALARALIVEPDVLLLDEPTAHLDPARVALVERTVAEYRERRPAIVWATHNLFQAKRTADRVCLLLDGAVVEIAPTSKFFESPDDSRTRDFVEGRMIY